MSRKSRAVADSAGASDPQPRTGMAPPRPAVTVAILLVLPAVALVADGNLSVEAVVVRFVAAIALTWVGAVVIGSTVGSARRSIAAARAQAAADAARARHAARVAKSKAAAATGSEEETGQEQVSPGAAPGGPTGSAVPGG